MQCDLASEFAPELEADSGRLPYVSLETIPPENGNYNWRDHFRRLLIELREPLVDKKNAPLVPDYAPNGMPSVNHKAMSLLRHSVEQALVNRRPKAVFLDEAQHLAKLGPGRRLLDQLDVLKSTANRTATVYVLFGTYDLLFFHHLSGQLSRRSIDVHFPRYSADEPGDLELFKNVVLTFQKRLPLTEPADLMENWEFLYERSVGCVGILKEWLERAVAITLQKGCEKLELSTLRETALSVAQCDKILGECRAGELALREKEDDFRRLRNRLGLVNGSGPDEFEAQLRKPVGTAVGRRKPRRDRIGWS
jgi:hypothetical protein